MEFNGYFLLKEGLESYALLGLYLEAVRRETEKKIQRLNVRHTPNLFGDSPYKRPEYEGCPVTPLSSYDEEIGILKKYAASGPDQMAQVLLFSPLSARAPFDKHWENFPMIMFLLQHASDPKTGMPFNQHVDEEALKEVFKSFVDKNKSLKLTVSGWKYKTIAQVWNNRESIYHNLMAAARKGIDEAIIAAIMNLVPTGVQSVKAGFIAQLLFGKVGCIDTHNVDIYSALYPDLTDRIMRWRAGGDKSKESVRDYIKDLETLQKRIGSANFSRDLWDVWVDFVAHFYSRTVKGGGPYSELGPAINPNDPRFEKLKIFVNKQAKGGSTIPVPTITGWKSGRGAGIAHRIATYDPADVLKKYVAGDEDEAMRAVKVSGDPAIAHYFGKAVDPKTGEIDYDLVKRIINRKVTPKQMTLFPSGPEPK